MATGASVEACEIPWAVAAIEDMAGHLDRKWTNRMPSLAQKSSRFRLGCNALVPIRRTAKAIPCDSVMLPVHGQIRLL
jgi:hypothetical protein